VGNEHGLKVFFFLTHLNDIRGLMFIAIDATLAMGVEGQYPSWMWTRPAEMISIKT
jgi:hypothetical protein